MPKINGVGYEIARHVIGPALQLLRRTQCANQPVAAIFSSLVRQLNNWRHSRRGTGRVGPYENLTLSEEEAATVYDAYDKAFDATFHGIEGMSRQESSLFVEQLVLDVGAGLKDMFAYEESDKVLLQDFLAKCENLLENVEVRPIAN